MNNYYYQCSIFAGIILFCYGCSLNTPPSSVNVKPDFSLSGCFDANYQHKSADEIGRMKTAEKLDELVREQLYHMPSIDNYGFEVIGRSLRKDGEAVLPELAQYLKAFDNNRASTCGEKRFLVVIITADDLDNHVFRIRGSKIGRLLIEELESQILKLEGTSSNDQEQVPITLVLHANNVLNGLKGINIVDRKIQDTLRVRGNITLNDEELSSFVGFLTLKYPSYPSWSEVGDFGPPPTFKDVQKYTEAFAEFKRKE